MQGQKCSRNLVDAQPPLARTIATQGGFVCMPSIMAMGCVLEKYQSGPCPACCANVYATRCAQEIFPQILYACQKGMCVISGIQYFFGEISDE